MKEKRIDNITEQNLRLEYVKKCYDYELLEKNLTKDELYEIDNVLRGYCNYKREHTNSENDVVAEYISKYGNADIVEWVEGLKDTELFIKEFNLKHQKIGYEL